MIRRPPRSTRVRSSAASDVYKRQNQGWGTPVDGRNVPAGACPQDQADYTNDHFLTDTTKDEKWLVLVGRPSLAAFRWRARRPAPPSYFHIKASHFPIIA